MRVYLSLLMFSATLFFSSSVMASDLLIPPTYCLKETGPGLYLRLRDDGALTAKLALSSKNEVKDANGWKVDAPERYSFFVGPEFGTKNTDMSANTAAGMPAVDNIAGSRLSSDYGVQCGFTWKFK